MNLKNAPDEFDSVYLQPGVAKMTSTVDTKLQNAVSFTINLEDHTMGQLLWAQLLTDPTVLFAGYKVPHPLEHKIVVKIETTGDSSPKKALEKAIEALQEELNKFEEQFHHRMSSFVSARTNQAPDDYM